MANQNYNLSTSTNFKAEIVGARDFNYFVQSVTLPSLSMGGVEAPFRNFQGVVPSNRIEFDPVTFQYLVAEDLSNYLYIYQWMLDIRKSNNLVEQLKDISLHILNNNKLANKKIMFYGAFPTSLGELNFESNISDSIILTNTASFRYQYFDIE